MKQDDLTQLKHVGMSRMKLLNDFGIKTLKQLHELPLEKLAHPQNESQPAERAPGVPVRGA